VEVCCSQVGVFDVDACELLRQKVSEISISEVCGISGAVAVDPFVLCGEFGTSKKNKR
jgi:hypothetical protein